MTQTGRTNRNGLKDRSFAHQAIVACCPKSDAPWGRIRLGSLTRFKSSFGVKVVLMCLEAVGLND